MSIYYALHGIDQLAPLLLRVLDLGFDLPRFRDIHLSGDGKTIMLLTRTGGLNRSEYRDFHRRIRRHPNFLSDLDDDWDESYATIRFSVPEFAMPFMAIEATGKEPLTLRQKTELALDELGKMSPEELLDPQVNPLADVAKKLSELLGIDDDKGKDVK